jgi:uncharacterized MAPEG superfamily protein
MTLANANEYKWPILATALYFALYFAYLTLIMLVKKVYEAEIKATLKKKNGGQQIELAAFNREIKSHPGLYRADRAQLNMLEQMPLFFVAMWLYAAFVDPVWAGYLGLLYTAIRSLYYALYTNLTVLMAVVTYPNYAIVWYMLLSVAFRAWNVF